MQTIEESRIGANSYHHEEASSQFNISGTSLAIFVSFTTYKSIYAHDNYLWFPKRQK